MDHAITVGEVLAVSGIAVAASVLLGIVVYALTVYASGFNR